MSMHDHIEKGLLRTTESADVEFKSAFDTSSAGDWLEIIKDVIAMSNSGGGLIFIGLNDDGSPSGVDITAIHNIDPADITNRIHKYTSNQFSGFELIKCSKESLGIWAIAVMPTRIPIVFTRVGTYEIAEGKQKTAFSVGTIYFRHGAKSEPCSSDDLRSFIERELELTRKSWLDGITKVVESPIGARFAVLPPENTISGPSGSIPMRLTSDPDAPAYYAVPLDNTHPYRQKEVVYEVNLRLIGKKITSHDILCIRRVYEIQKNISYCYTQNYASPRYSQQFVDWIVAKHQENNDFFEKTRVEFDSFKAASLAKTQ